MKSMKLDGNLSVVVNRKFFLNVKSRSLGVHKLIHLLLAQVETGETKIYSYICDADELVDFLLIAGKNKNRSVDRLIKESKEAYYLDGTFERPLFEVAERADGNSVIFKLSDFVFEFLPVFMGSVVKFCQ